MNTHTHTSLRFFPLALKLIVICFLTLPLSLSAQRTMKLIGEPDNSHGYLIWSGDTSVIEYYKYTISERIVDISGVQLAIVERGEIWERSYM